MTTYICKRFEKLGSEYAGFGTTSLQLDLT